MDKERRLNNSNMARLNREQFQRLKDLVFMTYLNILQGVIVGFSFGIPVFMQNINVADCKLNELMSNVNASTNSNITKTNTTLVNESHYNIYMKQSIFRLSAWPLGLKCLWAPIIDTYYIKLLGRRKTYIIPSYGIISLVFLILPDAINKWIYDEESKLYLVYTFFTWSLVYVCVGTIDITIDGWAITLLGPKHSNLAAISNMTGNAIGMIFGAVLIVLFNEENIIKTPIFMKTCGILFLISTICLCFIKEDEDQSSQQNLKEDEIFLNTSSVSQNPSENDKIVESNNTNNNTSNNDSNLNLTSNQHFKNSNIKNSQNLYNTEIFQTNLNSQFTSLPPSCHNSSDNNSNSKFSIVEKNESSNLDKKFTDWEETGHKLKTLLSSEGMKLFTILIFINYLPFGTTDSAAKLKMIDFGICKKYISYSDLGLYILGGLIPVLIQKLTYRPVFFWKYSFIFKLGMSIIVGIALVYISLNLGNLTVKQGLIIFTLANYGYAAGFMCIHVSIFSMACKLADPDIGGTSISLLISISNLLMGLNMAFALFLIAQFDRLVSYYKFKLFNKIVGLDGYLISYIIMVTLGLIGFIHIRPKLLVLHRIIKENVKMLQEKALRES